MNDIDSFENDIKHHIGMYISDIKNLVKQFIDGYEIGVKMVIINMI